MCTGMITRAGMNADTHQCSSCLLTAEMLSLDFTNCAWVLVSPLLSLDQTFVQTFSCENALTVALLSHFFQMGLHFFIRMHTHVYTHELFITHLEVRITCQIILQCPSKDREEEKCDNIEVNYAG